MSSGGDWARIGKPQSKTLRLSQSNLPAPWNELRAFPPNNFSHESYLVGYTSTIIPPSPSLSVKRDCIDGNLLAFAQIPVARSLHCRLRHCCLIASHYRTPATKSRLFIQLRTQDSFGVAEDAEVGHVGGTALGRTSPDSGGCPNFGTSRNSDPICTGRRRRCAPACPRVLAHSIIA